MKRTAILLLLTGLVISAYAVGKASVRSEAKFNRLRHGVNMCGVDYKWPCYHQVPDAFEGDSISIRKHESKDPLEFTVKKEGLVSIVTDPRGLSSLTEQGWVKIDAVEIIWFNGEIRELILMQKELLPGDYSLASHGQSGVRLIK